MAVQIVVTTDRYNRDPASREFVDFVRKEQSQLKLEDSVLYYDFPAYVTYEASSIRPDVLLFSPCHGFLAVRFLDDSIFSRSREAPSELDAGLNDFCSNLYSRLLRSKELRATRTSSIVDVFPVLFDVRTVDKEKKLNTESFDSEICTSYEGFRALLGSLLRESLDIRLIDEIRSVVEGAKALYRAQKRIVSDPANQPLAAAMAKLESTIANFDERQRHIALVDVGGPARIRGLAGSGKTVILAMKVAHLHLNNPEATILVTFFTKSLRATIKNLVTKFYRHYSESDPNWAVVHIRHGWGGASIPGVYSEACRRNGRAPLTFAEASRLGGGTKSAFDAACQNLIDTTRVRSDYDHVLIDEGQDFPSTFYQLCYLLAKGERDKKSIVWAYDELQDILNIKIRQPEELFGNGEDGKPLVSLDRTSGNVPPGATNDAVLGKCYRNQRDVLVTAHALGFGVYGTIVQLLESSEHWEDVGYKVLSGPLVTGKKVKVVRPDENSPLLIQHIEGVPLIDTYAAESLDAEVNWVCERILSFISGGLGAEEIVVISLDDRTAKRYLFNISEKLALAGIASNNIIADPYNEPPFTIAEKVTLSTVYRAKGNEAACIFAVGVDAIETRTRSGRNKLFTAFTRSKAWLRVSGVGPATAPLLDELKKALTLAPSMEFVMPDLKEVETIQRGFSKKQSKAKAARDEYIRKLREAGMTDQEIDDELAFGVNP